MGAPELEPVGEGTLLGGKYLLEKRLGAGGMGEVFRAQNTLIGRDVAIKVLRREHAENAEIVTRFLREARAANLVRHTNVVDVLDIGQDARGTPFIVQELLLGEDLAHRVTDLGGRVPLDVALRILLPVIDAVAFGHAKGVVHRDLKPENVFLAQVEGKIVPKLLDFGISQIKGSPNDPRMTVTGMAMGTPAYMSPEQIQGQRVDARADVWALGIILHEIISGTLPFLAESQGGLFVQICTAAPVTLLEAAPHAPPELEAIVLRCLKKAREERYPDAAQLGHDLRKLWDALCAPKNGRTSGGHPAATPARVDPDDILGNTDRPAAPDLLAQPRSEAPNTVIHAAQARRAAAPLPVVPDLAVPDLAMPAKAQAVVANVAPASVAKQKAATPSATHAVAKPSPATNVIGNTVEGFGFDDDESSAISGLKLENDSLRAPPLSRHRARPSVLESLIPPASSVSLRSVLAGLGLIVGVGVGMAGIRYLYETFDVYSSVVAAKGDLKVDTGIVMTAGVILALLGLIAVPKTYRSLRDAPALGIALSLLIALLLFGGVELVIHTFD